MAHVHVPPCSYHFNNTLRRGWRAEVEDCEAGLSVAVEDSSAGLSFAMGRTYPLFWPNDLSAQSRRV